MRNILALVLVMYSFRLFAEGPLTIDESSVDFGEQFQFSEIKKDITVLNRSDAPVKLSTSNTGDPKFFGIEPAVLEPRAHATIHVDIPLSDQLGYFGRRYQIIADRNGTEDRYPISISGFVDSILDTPNPGVDFGVVNATKPEGSRTLRLASSLAPKLSISKIIDSPEFVDAHVSQTGNELVLTPKSSNVLGYRKGIVKLSVNADEQPEVWVNVLADFHGDFVADQNPLSFGLQRPGSLRPVRLQIKSRDGAPFSVEKLTIDAGAHAFAKPVDCIPKATPDCHAYMFEVDKTRPQGQISGSTKFAFAHSRETLDVLFEGIFLLDETKIRSLNEADPSKQSVAKPKVDLSTAISSVVTSASEPEPPGRGPLLKWKVANESGIYGYAIFRGDSVEGAFARVNSTVVKAKNTGDNGEASYQYRDNTAEPGKEYWYYVSIFYNSGKKVQLTGQQRVVAK